MVAESLTQQGQCPQFHPVLEVLMEPLITKVVDSSRMDLDPITVNLDSISPQTAQCLACGDDTTHFIRAPCNDIYCIPCICELFERAAGDEEFVPPRCCRRDIPLDLVAPYLQVSLRGDFIRKLEERNTSNRVQWTNSSRAGTFADEESEVIQRSECNTCICTLSNPAEDKETIEFCREQGWQRCPGCRTMIELTQGCYHMTCLCQAEFCYLCGAVWKNCYCPHSDEECAVENADDPTEFIQDITWAELQDFEQYMINYLMSEEGTAVMNRISERLGDVPVERES